MRVVIANFSNWTDGPPTPGADWPSQSPSPPARRQTLFEYEVGWGFHIMALGIHLMDQHLAHDVEFWQNTGRCRQFYHASGMRWVEFVTPADVEAYLQHRGIPELFINYGVEGERVLEQLEGRCFRVHVPCSRAGWPRQDNHGAECYLVDDERYLDGRSMLYIPVVNLRKIVPGRGEKTRDFIYLAVADACKRHDLLLRAVRGTPLTGHLHPVQPGQLDLEGTPLTTTAWNEADVLNLIQTSRIAVYPGDVTSNPAAMWECVAGGLPIVVNRNILGGRHVVVPGVTGELAGEKDFRAVMTRVLERRDQYRPRAWFEQQWDTVTLLEQYLAFFRRMGWGG